LQKTKVLPKSSSILIASLLNRVILEEDRSLCGHVIYDIRRMVASFSSCSIKHVASLLNVVFLMRIRRFSLVTREKILMCRIMGYTEVGLEA
jgi:hypothetical protein